MVFLVLLLLPRISSGALGMFQCTDVEDKSYLLTDFSVTCFDDK
jgi:hypothetical protein